MQQEEGRLCKLIRKFTIMLVMRIDILLADLRYLASDTGALNLSEVLLARPCTVQLWKLQLKENEGGLEKWRPCGCCKKINHFSLAVVQTSQYSRASPLDKNVQEAKIIWWLITLGKEVVLEEARFMMPRFAPTSSTDEDIRLCFFLQPGQAIFVLKSDRRRKASPPAGVIWEFKNTSSPLAYVVQEHLFSCGNSGYNTGPLLRSYTCRSESRVQHREFKLAPISIPFSR